MAILHHIHSAETNHHTLTDSER